jgi:hypothetical protein
MDGLLVPPMNQFRSHGDQIIDAEQVRRLLPMAECIDVMAEAMKAASGGDVVQPMRTVLPVDDGGGHFFVMPAASKSLGCYGAKLISLTPANAGKSLPAIRGQYLLFESDTGAAVALIDASSLTALRTAAASGLAARLLARPDATTCGIFGTGVQAATHAEAMCNVRPSVRSGSGDATCEGGSPRAGIESVDRAHREGTQGPGNGRSLRPHLYRDCCQSADPQGPVGSPRVHTSAWSARTRLRSARRTPSSCGAVKSLLTCSRRHTARRATS